MQSVWLLVLIDFCMLTVPESRQGKPKHSPRERARLSLWRCVGADLVPLMLAGSSGRDGKGPDFSGMHTGVLWGGSTVLAGALVRVFGPSLAEIPLLATRPEAQVGGLIPTLAFMSYSGARTCQWHV